MEPDVNPDVRRRIIAAADELYEQNGRTAFPNVDSVRRRAKVNMNDASVLMKEWRRIQGPKAPPIPSQIPDDVQKAGLAGLEQLWAAAQECANRNLRTAQAGWELERAENEALSLQLSSAFDAQAKQMTELQLAFEQASQRYDEAETHNAALTAEVAELTKTASDMKSRALAGEAKAGELERRANDLRGELERLHAEHQRCQEKEESSRKRQEMAEGAFRAELQSATSTAHTSAIEIARLQEEVRGLKQRLEIALSQVEASQRSAAASDKRADVADRRIASLESDLALKRAESQTLAASMEETRNCYAQVQGERNVLAMQYQKLMERLDNMTMKGEAMPPSPTRKQRSRAKLDGDKH